MVETVQSTINQLPEEDIISPIIGVVSPPDPRVRLLANQQTPTLDEDIRSMTEYEAENQESYDWNAWTIILNII